MKLRDSFGKKLSNSFLIAIIVFGLFLTYMTVQAKKVADSWQKANDDAVSMFEDNIKK